MFDVVFDPAAKREPLPERYRQALEEAEITVTQPSLRFNGADGWITPEAAGGPQEPSETQDVPNAVEPLERPVATTARDEVDILDRAEIRRRRLTLALSFADAAERAGWGRAARSRWYHLEIGSYGRHGVNLCTLRDVATALNCRVGEILTDR